MDPEAAPSPKTESPELAHPEAVASAGEKRRVSDGEDAGSLLPSPKKPRSGAGDLGRVAEIVLVLSAMGRMRGGRDPTEVELGLMAEARERLAAICETLSPKDIVAGDAIVRVMEDLGLNGKARDQRMGFKVPKLSIAEKLAFTRRKMEESKKHPTHTTTYISPSLQANFIAGADNRGMIPTRTFQSDKPSQPPVSAGSIGASPSPVYTASTSPATVSMEKSTSVTYHFGASELRTSTVSSAVSGGHLGKDTSSLAAPKVERSPDVVEVGSNVAPRMPAVQASSSVNQPLASAPAWSVPAPPTSLSRFGSEKNVLHHTPGKAQEAPNITASLASPQDARDQARRPHVTRAASDQPSAVHHQPLQGITSAAPLSYPNHYEIAKLVQKFLPPKLPEHPTWTPPSREYMNKALSCQICQTTVNDVESVLVCDACEKGYHLKCLQSQNQRGIPKVEWHCQKCLALSHGKPLPPKYGRVMRNMATPKVSANVANAQSSSEKKVGTADTKVNQQKLMSTESSGSQNPAAGATVSSSHAKSFSDAQLPKERDLPENNPSVGGEIHQKSFSECVANNSMKYVGSSFCSPDGTLNERSIEDVNKCEPSMGEATPASQAKPETSANESDLSSSLHNPSDERDTEPAVCAGDHPETCENSISKSREAEKSYADGKVGSSVGSDMEQERMRAESNVDSNAGSNAKQEKSCADDNIDSNIKCFAKPEKSCEEDNFASNTRSETKQDGVGMGLQDPGLSSGADVESRENAALPLDVLQGAEFSDVLELVDGKAFYGSCCIAGITYKLNQHALFNSYHGKLVPSKLQAMWEDKVTGLKWVKVNRCYFPGDLPDNVGRPFTETNEVFESNHEETFMLGTIRGPCEVLRSTKYRGETERQNHEGNGHIPKFLCKWFYDESKGHFQAVSS